MWKSLFTILTLAGSIFQGKVFAGLLCSHFKYVIPEIISSNFLFSVRENYNAISSSIQVSDPDLLEHKYI